MCLNANFVIVIITSFYICSMCYKRIEYGKACGEGANRGTCKTILECPSALVELKKMMYSFESCGFLANNTQIICCKDFKTAPLTNHNHEITNDDGRIWERLPPILLDKSGVRKSVAACREYIKNTGASINYQITGGKNAILGEFPHMAQIGYDSLEFVGATVWKCGGSLIHVRFVLTAAHCAETIESPPKVVRMGFVDSSLPGNTNFVESTILNYTVHPNYDRTSKLNDIALIELVDEVKFGTNVRPACLYQQADEPTDLIATGWGSTSTEDDDMSNANILQQVYINPIDLKNCSELYSRFYKRNITSRQMCRLTPNSTADTCQGDSGGPLQNLTYPDKFIYHIVGVTSYGGGCGDGKTPGVYARVSSYIDWIESIVWP